MKWKRIITFGAIFQRIAQKESEREKKKKNKTKKGLSGDNARFLGQ